MGGLKLDVRHKFFLLILISAVAFAAKDVVYENIIFVIVCLLSFLLGQGKKVVKFAGVYGEKNGGSKYMN